jgi:hypothetical protein
MNYWGGAAINSGKCACWMTNTCEGGQPRCNCDAGLWSFRDDSGYLIDITTLPVTQLRFGDTDGSSEQGFHTLGKLRCWGWEVIQSETNKICRTISLRINK